MCPGGFPARETAELIRVLEPTRAELLHIYFGHIAVHFFRSSANGQGRASFPSMAPMSWSTWKSRRIAPRPQQDARSGAARPRALGFAPRALVSLGCSPTDKIRLQRTGIPLYEFEFRARALPQNGHWQLLQAGRLIAKKGIRPACEPLRISRAKCQRRV